MVRAGLSLNDELVLVLVLVLDQRSEKEEPRKNFLKTAQLQQAMSGITWAVAPADSRAHLFGVSSRASWYWQPQPIAETRVPTVRRPSPRRRVAQPGLSRRIGAG